MTTLPRPDVKVTKPTPQNGTTPSEHAVDAVISRGGHAQSIQADGGTTQEVVEKVIRQIIDSPKTLEWLP
jgi:hypothetical protein